MVLNGRERGRVVRLPDASAAVVGQRQDADVPLGDAWISWEHARIAREGPGFAIEDLQSTNGTYVNTAKVERAALRHDDVIFLGRTHILFCEGEPPAGAAAGLPPAPGQAQAGRALSAFAAEAERSLGEDQAGAEQTLRLKLDQAQGLFAGPLVGIDDDAVLEIDTDDGVGPDLLESLEIVEAAPSAAGAAPGGGERAALDDDAGADDDEGAANGAAAKDAEIARLRAALASKDEEVRRLLDEIQALKEKYLDL